MDDLRPPYPQLDEGLNDLRQPPEFGENEARGVSSIVNGDTCGDVGRVSVNRSILSGIWRQLTMVVFVQLRLIIPNEVADL